MKTTPTLTGVALPPWWSALCAVGGVLCLAGVISRWLPLLIVALAVQWTVAAVYVRHRRRSARR